MTLNLLLIIPFVGALSAWFFGRSRPTAARWISAGAMIAYFILTLSMSVVGSGDSLIFQFERAWIPQIGATYHLTADAVSLIMVMLTGLTGIFAVIVSWNRIGKQAGFYYFNLLAAVSAVTGVFLSSDLLLFYFFWEIMLIPLYFLIGIWGGEKRTKATLKFFIFTQLSGLFMLVSILGLYFAHGNLSGVYTFGYQALIGTAAHFPGLATWLMFGFFVAFAVKLPIFPLHTWLPDAYTEAPIGVSLLLAGIVSKTAAYGLLRFLVPLFPQKAEWFAPAAMILGVTGILYGAALAFSQTNLKKLISYSSVGHMGFIVLGIFAWNSLALQGVMVMVVAHALSTGGLFIFAGDLKKRLGTYDIDKMGGLRDSLPRMNRTGIFLAMASLGLPGILNFVGEFLILLGVYRSHPIVDMAALAGMVLALIYSVRMVQKIFAGNNEKELKAEDYGRRSLAVMSIIIVLLVGLGMYPQPLLDMAKPALTKIGTLTVSGISKRSSDTKALVTAVENKKDLSKKGE